MNPLSAIKQLFKKKELGHSLESQTWGSVAGSTIFSHWKVNDYENAYPSINRISNMSVMTEPYTIDKNGKPVESNILDRIYTPNTEMSAQDFREALAIMTLVHNRVNLRVHYKGNKITANSITGFTFIESPGYILNKKWHFRLPGGEIITSDEVITLKSINPYDIQSGFSPSQSAQKWIRIDDYIAEYQAGFFKNGAVPAGQFIVTAKTKTEFNDIVDRLEEKHKGATKNNNVSYVHRPTDSTGKAQEADVEWIPFNVQNKEMALKDLFEQANKKIDSAYGVPASIRGVNDTNTYASVRVDEVIFNKYVVDPFLLKLWGKFTHELNRVTGGTGVAITYDLDIPTLADEEKVKAEAKQAELSIITLAQAQGYSLDSIVDAFQLSNSYKLLKSSGKPVIHNDKPQVADSQELTETPEPEKKSVEAESVELTEQIPQDIKQPYIEQMSKVAKDYLQEQVTEAIAEVDSKTVSKVSIKDLASRFLSILIPYMTIEGVKQRQVGMQILLTAGLDTSGAGQFSLSTAQITAYRTYLEKVATSYTTTNKEGIRAILERGAEQQLNQAQIRTALREFAGEEWRAQRLALTEVNRAGSTASVNAMENISRDTGHEIVKVWNINPDACQFCQEFEGKTEPINQSFLKVGDTIEVDGKTLSNDFADVDDATLHPNCSCFTTYEVVG